MFSTLVLLLFSLLSSPGLSDDGITNNRFYVNNGKDVSQLPVLRVSSDPGEKNSIKGQTQEDIDQFGIFGAEGCSGVKGCDHIHAPSENAITIGLPNQAPWTFLGRNMQVKGIYPSLLHNAGLTKDKPFELLLCNGNPKNIINHMFGEENNIQLAILPYDERLYKAMKPVMPLFSQEYAILAPQKLRINSPEELRGKTLAVINYQREESLIKSLGIDSMVINYYEQGISLLQKGYADAMAGPRVHLMGLQDMSNQGSQLEIKLSYEYRSNWLWESRHYPISREYMDIIKADLRNHLIEHSFKELASKYIRKEELRFIHDLDEYEQDVN